MGVSTAADPSSSADSERRPAVSFLIPVYNAAPYLRRCLDSAIGQTFRDIEVVCVDDGSTDGGPAILAEYAARDPRIRVISQKNHGALHAYSEAARAARGEYFLCLDADDRSRTGIVERAIAAAHRHGVDVVEFAVTERFSGLLHRPRHYYAWGSPRKDHIGKVLEQPDIIQKSTYGEINCLLWNKLIRREVFLAAIGDIPPEVRAKKISHRGDTLLCPILLNRAKNYTAIADIGCDYTRWKSSHTWLQRADISGHLAMLDSFFLGLRTLHRILPPSLHPNLFEYYMYSSLDYIFQWKRFTRPQRLLAWQWLVDGFRFNERAHALFVGRVFGSKKILRAVTDNMRRRLPLALCPWEWPGGLLRLLGRGIRLLRT
ncbi:MAG: glycosyltransferase [Puniceicoccales bacterium]|jgi:glycosyltransferase involved in cell wall biosynthesis|nr:glycosyltransferase [Puniceicoccales bacterium]